MVLNYLTIFNLFTFQFVCKWFYQVVQDENFFKKYHKISRKITNLSNWHFLLKSNLKDLFDSVLYDIRNVCSENFLGEVYFTFIF